MDRPSSGRPRLPPPGDDGDVVIATSPLSTNKYKGMSDGHDVDGDGVEEEDGWSEQDGEEEDDDKGEDDNQHDSEQEKGEGAMKDGDGEGERDGRSASALVKSTPPPSAPSPSIVSIGRGRDPALDSVPPPLLSYTVTADELVSSSSSFPVLASSSSSASASSLRVSRPCRPADWYCFLQCGKHFKKSSGRSIRRHALQCYRRHFFNECAGKSDQQVHDMLAARQEEGQVNTGLRAWRLRQTRRAAQDLPLHERWECPHSCGQFYRSTSSKSIERHQSTCTRSDGHDKTTRRGDGDGDRKQHDDEEDEEDDEDEGSEGRSTRVAVVTSSAQPLTSSSSPSNLALLSTSAHLLSSSSVLTRPPLPSLPLPSSSSLSLHHLTGGGVTSLVPSSFFSPSLPPVHPAHSSLFMSPPSYSRLSYPMSAPPPHPRPSPVHLQPSGPSLMRSSHSGQPMFNELTGLTSASSASSFSSSSSLSYSSSPSLPSLLLTPLTPLQQLQQQIALSSLTSSSSSFPLVRPSPTHFFASTPPSLSSMSTASSINPTLSSFMGVGGAAIPPSSSLSLAHSNPRTSSPAPLPPPSSSSCSSSSLVPPPFSALFDSLAAQYVMDDGGGGGGGGGVGVNITATPSLSSYLLPPSSASLASMAQSVGLLAPSSPASSLSLGSHLHARAPSSSSSFSVLPPLPLAAPASLSFPFSQSTLAIQSTASHPQQQPHAQYPIAQHNRTTPPPHYNQHTSALVSSVSASHSTPTVSSSSPSVPIAHLWRPHP